MIDNFSKPADWVIPESGIVVTYNGKEKLIRTDITKKEIKMNGIREGVDDTNALFTCNLYILNGTITYAHLVSTIIRDKYTEDDVEAILLNHGDGDAKHEEEYKALQEYRLYAKTLAASILESLYSLIERV